MNHETTPPVTSLVDEVLADLDRTEKTHLDGEVRDMAREAILLIRQQQELIAQQGAPAVPDGWRLVPVRITPQMIEGALAAHYGARRLRQAGGPGGVDMTVNCINYNGTQAMKRMWAGALSAAPTPPEGSWESPCTPPAQQPVAWQDPDNLERMCSARCMDDAKRVGGATLTAVLPLTRPPQQAPVALPCPSRPCPS